MSHIKRMSNDINIEEAEFYLCKVSELIPTIDCMSAKQYDKLDGLALELTEKLQGIPLQEV